MENPTQTLALARQAVALGHRDAARPLLMQLARDPAGSKLGEVWHLLGQVLDDPAQRADCARRAAQLGYMLPAPATPPAQLSVTPALPEARQPAPLAPETAKDAKPALVSDRAAAPVVAAVSHLDLAAQTQAEWLELQKTLEQMPQEESFATLFLLPASLAAIYGIKQFDTLLGMILLVSGIAVSIWIVIRRQRFRKTKKQLQSDIARLADQLQRLRVQMPDTSSGIQSTQPSTGATVRFSSDPQFEITPTGKIIFTVQNSVQAKQLLQMLKLKKKELLLEKKELTHQQQMLRTDYTHDVRKRGSKVRGGGSVGRFVRTVQTISRDGRRASLANNLAPLENQRNHIEKIIQGIDQAILELEGYILKNS